MDNRPTKAITLPSGKIAELKTYVTARERNDLRDVFYRDLKVGAEGGKAEIKEISGEVMSKAEAKLLQLILVSYDGSAESAYDRLLEGTPEDYDEVVREANKISGGNFPKAK